MLVIGSEIKGSLLGGGLFSIPRDTIVSVALSPTFFIQHDSFPLFTLTEVEFTDVNLIHLGSSD